MTTSLRSRSRHSRVSVGSTRQRLDCHQRRHHVRPHIIRRFPTRFNSANAAHCPDPRNVSALGGDDRRGGVPSKRSIEPVLAAAVGISETRHESLKATEDDSDQSPPKRLEKTPVPEHEPVSTQPAST